MPLWHSMQLFKNKLLSPPGCGSRPGESDPGGACVGDGLQVGAQMIHHGESEHPTVRAIHEEALAAARVVMNAAVAAAGRPVTADAWSSREHRQVARRCPAPDTGRCSPASRPGHWRGIGYVENIGAQQGVKGRRAHHADHGGDVVIERNEHRLSRLVRRCQVPNRVVEKDGSWVASFAAALADPVATIWVICASVAGTPAMR